VGSCHTPIKHVVGFGDKGAHDILYSVKWRTLNISIPYVYMNATESAIGIEMKCGCSFLFLLCY
jgi:hypothetical protein